jgi:hypothetical protein
VSTLGQAGCQSGCILHDVIVCELAWVLSAPGWSKPQRSHTCGTCKGHRVQAYGINDRCSMCRMYSIEGTVSAARPWYRMRFQILVLLLHYHLTLLTQGRTDDAPPLWPGTLHHQHARAFT